ncbi:unnamed protein product [Gordionus sp. m RMFG-2023]
MSRVVEVSRYKYLDTVSRYKNVINIDDENDDILLWPIYRPYFKIISQNKENKSLLVKCLPCLPKNMQISVSITSTCNITVVAIISQRWENKKKEIIKSLIEPSLICTTADCWSAYRLSYIGVTAHYIDPTSLEIKYVALACKSMTGSHIYDKTAKKLQEIAQDYCIQNKISKTITNNVKNFIKSFRDFKPIENITESIDDLEDEETVAPISISDLYTTAQDFGISES